MAKSERRNFAFRYLGPADYVRRISVQNLAAEKVDP